MFQLIRRKNGRGIHWKDDLLAGLTVALALVPEAVAFAFVAGVDPRVGLYAAFIVGLFTASIDRQVRAPKFLLPKAVLD